MAGDSPLSMMRAAPRRSPRAPARPRPLRRCLIITAVVIVVAVGWCGSWYFAAGIADRAERGWIEREAALGRVYACGSQNIGGFPFSIVSRCDGAAATFSSNKPPFDVRAGGVTFSAQVFRPTLLNGEVQGPVTLANPGESPIFTANWTNARLTLLGLPPTPERIAVSLDKPRLDRLTPPNAGMIFQADSVTFDGSIVQGSAQSNPVIESVGHFVGATAPSTHPLLAEPLQGDIDAVMRGFKDFAPKPWPVLFREMQAAGGGIDIRSLRIERPDAVIVGSGTLTLNEHGKLEGQIDIAVAGIDNIVPLLGLDQMIGQGIDRLTGGSGSAAAGLGALDQLMPGLSGVVRQSASAGLISNIKKMGKPTEIDKKPAIALPLRVGDGVIYLGVIPVGALPALF